MSTISNELVKDLRMAFAVWQQDYDPVEDKEQYDMFGLGIVAMDELLALRKERERAEPEFYGPYTPVMVGAGVWVSIADELPPHLDGHKVWVTTSPTAPPAPVVPERDQVRADHAEWSKATFGSVGPIGPLKHLSKEALEAAAAPGDLSEWADMQFLLWDAQRRAGITDEKITQAMIDKLEVNKARQWPEPKDGEPRPHIQAETDTTSQQFESLARKAVVPEGWKLVPIEPTVEMQIAFAEAWFSKVRCVDDCELEDAYIAMLAAAPEPCK
ncbi:hypothetical protein ER21_06475 [Cronobacter sakazakii]|nr:hypothetical protein ER21_06475 [Cronobacter sakazakii]